MIHPNVLSCIGNTPIVQLNRVGDGCPARLYAKLEFMNPGGSVKDRIGYALIEDAEKRGLLKPGGTIVEATSGNTGVGLAIAANVKDYRCVFVMPDKMAREKIDTLRSFGATVVITPTGVDATDPRSHYSVGRKIAETTPGAYLTSQYDNLANRDIHYRKTGPEVLAQMPGIDVLVAGMGTGGTMSGTGKFLKEKKPGVKLVCADPFGSLTYDMYTHGKMVSPLAPYKVEGIGEDFVPKNFDLEILDAVVNVDDEAAFVMARRLLHEEGLFAGTSAGTIVAGALKWAKDQGEQAKGLNILCVLPDSGDRYMSKIWSDEWMREAGFLGDRKHGKSAALPLVYKVEGAKGDFPLWQK